MVRYLADSKPTSMRSLLFVLAVLLVSTASSQSTGWSYVAGANEILVDPNVMRTEFGYFKSSGYNLNDTINKRNADGIDLKVEVKIFSNLIDKYMNFVVHDAFHSSMQLGRIKSAVIGEHLPSGDFLRENKFAFSFNFGYDFYIGYRNKSWGLLAGVRPNWSAVGLGDFSNTASAGGLGLLSFSRPIALRAEWRPLSHFEYRVVLSAWSPLIGGVPWSGMKLELPTFPGKRFWLFIEYNKYRFDWEYLATDVHPKGQMELIRVGLRMGSIF